MISQNSHDHVPVPINILVLLYIFSDEGEKYDFQNLVAGGNNFFKCKILTPVYVLSGCLIVCHGKILIECGEESEGWQLSNLHYGALRTKTI